MWQKMEQGGGALDANLVKLFARQSAEKVARDVPNFTEVWVRPRNRGEPSFRRCEGFVVFEGTEETLVVRVVGREMMAN